MDIRQLEAFLWVSRLGSFTAAAHHLRLTQPAISKRISQLEESLGVKLFHGNTRNVGLTLQGRALDQYAVQAAELMTAIRAQIGQGDAIRGQFNIGAAVMIEMTWLTPYISGLRQTYPNLELNLTVDLSYVLRNQLNNQNLDLAILFGPTEQSNLITRRIGKLETWWVASPKLGIPAGPVGPADLSGLPILSLTRRSDLYYEVQNWFRAGHVMVPRFTDCNSLYLILQLVSEGLGATIMPPALVKEEIANGTLMAYKPNPPLPPIQFDAAYPVSAPQPLTEHIVQFALACAKSDSVFGPTIKSEDE
jgi:DNA-binding transcriptional LysR family regulator